MNQKLLIDTLWKAFIREQPDCEVYITFFGNIPPISDNQHCFFSEIILEEFEYWLALQSVKLSLTDTGYIVDAEECIVTMLNLKYSTI